MEVCNLFCGRDRLATRLAFPSVPRAPRLRAQPRPRRHRNDGAKHPHGEWLALFADSGAEDDRHPKPAQQRRYRREHFVVVTVRHHGTEQCTKRECAPERHQ